MKMLITIARVPSSQSARDFENQGIWIKQMSLFSSICHCQFNLRCCLFIVNLPVKTLQSEEQLQPAGVGHPCVRCKCMTLVASGGAADQLLTPDPYKGQKLVQTQPLSTVHLIQPPPQTVSYLFRLLNVVRGAVYFPPSLARTQRHNTQPLAWLLTWL